MAIGGFTSPQKPHVPVFEVEVKKIGPFETVNKARDTMHQ
jgi:hypothetical protein